MTSPYGPGGGNDPQQPWGQQPYGGGPASGTPSGGFPAQPGYGQQQPPGQPYGQPEPPPYGGYGQPQPTQQQPYGGYGQPQPTQQQPYGAYGQQPGYPGAAPQKRKSSAWIWILSAIVVLGVAAFLVLGLVTPGFLKTKVLDEGALEGDNGVKKVLTAKPPQGYDVPKDKIQSVDCPSGKEVKAGTEFDCKVTIDGQEQTVHIKIRDDAGQYEVSAPS